MHSTRQDNRPSWQFYPNDWVGNNDLNLCGLKAQGLWIRMLCLMFFSPIRGELRRSNGEQITNRDLAKLTGESEEKIGSLLKELYDNGVFSYTEDKVIYCRRMKSEGEIYKAKQKAGLMSGISRNKKRTEEQHIAEEEVEETIEKEEDTIIRYCFIILQTIPKYPLDINTDRELLTDLKQEYSDIDLPKAIKGWKDWLTENKQKNLRLGLRNWIMKSKEFKDKREDKDRIVQEGIKADREQKAKERVVEHRKAMPMEKVGDLAGKFVKELEGEK